jgi:hypothetical protein
MYAHSGYTLLCSVQPLPLLSLPSTPHFSTKKYLKNFFNVLSLKNVLCLKNQNIIQTVKNREKEIKDNSSK